MTSCPAAGETESSKQPAVGPVLDTPSTDTTLGSNCRLTRIASTAEASSRDSANIVDVPGGLIVAPAIESCTAAALCASARRVSTNSGRSIRGIGIIKVLSGALSTLQKQIPDRTEAAPVSGRSRSDAGKRCGNRGATDSANAYHHRRTQCTVAHAAQRASGYQ